MSDESITRGVRLAAERPEVMMDEASERIRSVYEDIQRTLRVPIINLIFRTLANDPEYFVPAWERTAPVARTRAFEAAADGLRAAAVLDAAPDHPELDRDDIGPLATIRAFNDTIHYVLPKLLLIVTAWDEGGWNGQSGDERPIPSGIADGTGKAPMVKMEDASDRVRQLFEREKRAHGHPLVSSYYRVLANWPDFLEPAWTRVEPLVGSEPYRERMGRLVTLATAAVAELPLPASIPDQARTEEISHLLAAFRREFIPSMMLDVGLIKAMLDGKDAARSSPFSPAL
ncbi:halocarboxylic acid dehydrogenase DehI family protein [Lysobacter korlensis]|uniref:Halocarboxylic acid dehydrogenase DehI family protein n=1 Tax=Lysobacter korlensis TaxID=553636 RepID=A0ABV6RLV5_9GAMM